MQPRYEQHEEAINALHRAALAAAEPCAAVRAALQRLPLPGCEGDPLALIAIGKAAAGMMRGALDSAAGRPLRGLAIGPEGTAERLGFAEGVAVIESDHPTPSGRSAAAGSAALEFAARSAIDGAPLVALISGGASSLACVPEAGLGINDLARLSRALSHAGTPIEQLNLVRALCDRLKGGGLADAAGEAEVVTYILSDIVGGRADLVGSGPTTGHRGSPAEALSVLKRADVEEQCAAVAAHLRLLASTAEPARAPSRERPMIVIGSNRTSLEAAADAAKAQGFRVVEVRDGVTGEARETAFDFVAALRRHRRANAAQPVAVLWGGETTVTVRGGGRGGRNLEAALAAAITLDGEQGAVVATLATDGIDGSSDLAGAIVTGRTAEMARRTGSDPEDFLARNDSHGFFQRVGGGVTLGPTGTNVNDIWIGLVY